MGKYSVYLDGMLVDRGVAEKPRSLSLRDLLNILTECEDRRDTLELMYSRCVVVYEGIAYIPLCNGEWAQFMFLVS